MSTYCFPVLIFCFYLYLKLCLARELTYCHIRNVTGDRVCGVRADLRYLVLISCGCAWASLFPDNSKPVAMLAIRLYNGNSSGQLTQTCPALAIKTATILELVSRVEVKKLVEPRNLLCKEKL